MGFYILNLNHLQSYLGTIFLDFLVKDENLQNSHSILCLWDFDGTRDTSSSSTPSGLQMLKRTLQAY